MKIRYAFGLLALLLAGCQTLGVPAPKTPAQAVFEARGSELAAITLANQYKALPPCAPMVKICSDPKVVILLQKAANAADAVLDSAQATVTDPTFKDSPAAAKAALAAQNALGALTAITAQLALK
jgi:hypothetical protein